MEFSAQGFWFVLTLACIAWYSTVTVIVAVKGGLDIRNLLKRIRRDGREP